MFRLSAKWRAAVERIKKYKYTQWFSDFSISRLITWPTVINQVIDRQYKFGLKWHSTHLQAPELGWTNLHSWHTFEGFVVVNIIGVRLLDVHSLTHSTMTLIIPATATLSLLYSHCYSTSPKTSRMSDINKHFTGNFLRSFINLSVQRSHSWQATYIAR